MPTVIFAAAGGPGGRPMGVAMEQLTVAVKTVSDFVWNNLLLWLLVGTGILFTLRTRFVQLRQLGRGFSQLLGGFSLKGAKAGKEGMSSFQALTTAIAAQVGTGNITGCATALYNGGPGAIFWMWLSAFFGGCMRAHVADPLFPPYQRGIPCGDSLRRRGFDFVPF